MLTLLTALLIPIAWPARQSPPVIHPGVAAFAKAYPAFEMPIDGAGLATIPSVGLDAAGALTIAYRYRSEGEDRAGEMTLRPRERPGVYRGSWRTEATNGNVYAGELTLRFADDGTAAGTYTYAGAEYGIAIRRRAD